MPAIEKTITLKVPVSLRLPVSLAKQVEQYANENRLTKTDAYEHFLRLGLECSGSEESSTAQLSSLAEKLDKILYFVSLDGEELGDECSVGEKEKAKQLPETAGHCALSMENRKWIQEKQRCSCLWRWRRPKTSAAA